jgi:signal transduction histidine kinase
MSLRFRLVTLILALVTLVAVALSALQLRVLVDSLSAASLDRANIIGNQVSKFLIDHINQHSGEYPTQENLEQTKTVWRDIVAHDPDITDYLLSAMAPSELRTLIEINVADEAGQVLASSNPEAVGFLWRRREPFSAWNRLPWYRRIYDLLRRRPDWEILPRPIGIAGGGAVLQVQVVSSSVFVRDLLAPQLRGMSVISAAALLVTLLLTLGVTQRILRPIGRIERTIDRITQGNYRGGEAGGSVAKEFRAVESKLRLLGQQISGIIAPAAPRRQRGLDAAVEGIAKQLDVAARLAAISRLTGGVAHEIKNPLNAIQLRLELLKERLGESDPDLDTELELLSREVLRLNRVVKTFLDFSRPVDVHFEDVDLAKLTRELADFVTPQAEAAKIAVECVVPEDPCGMSGDLDLLRQAILNLVTNAIEAMTDQGGGVLRLSVEPCGDTWALKVSDTGPGIPEDLRDKVFQLYFTNKPSGSGIGLAMTYRAAQLHNGSIRFESEGGKGTTFRMEFPAVAPHV